MAKRKKAPSKFAARWKSTSYTPPSELTENQKILIQEWAEYRERETKRIIDEYGIHVAAEGGFDTQRLFMIWALERFSNIQSLLLETLSRLEKVERRSRKK